MPEFIQLQAGASAMAQIRKHGLSPDMVSHFGAAAGGPKWLVLGHLDRWMFTEWFAGREQPLIATGSSAGIWRLACLAQSDPVAAIDRFEAAYMQQRYTERPSANEVSRQGGLILDALLGANGRQEIPAHRWLKLNIVAARGRLGTASRNALLQALGLAGASLANAISRRAMGAFMERVLVHADGGALQLQADGFVTHHVPMTSENLVPALMASATIPRVMAAVDAIPGAPSGPYVDGGMIDYHMDLPLAAPEGLTLIPHFSSRVTPGWLDKFLPWRGARHLHQALVISPSAKLLARFPKQRIPDRHDFARYAGDDEGRIRDWGHCVDESRAMADEFRQLLQDGTLADHLVPIQHGR